MTEPAPTPQTHAPTPGQDRLGNSIARFDQVSDRALDRLRGRPVVDGSFRLASEIADFSAIWHVANLVRGTAVRRPDQVLGLALALAAESLVVNQGVKRLFRRERPTTSGDARTPVRTPSTSAFPSGHASAAAFNATVLTAWDRRRAPLWWTLAAWVGLSRAHVRIHHPSDVVGGAVVGVALGVLAVRVLRRLGITA